MTKVGRVSDIFDGEEAAKQPASKKGKRPTLHRLVRFALPGPMQKRCAQHGVPAGCNACSVTQRLGTCITHMFRCSLWGWHAHAAGCEPVSQSKQ